MEYTIIAILLIVAGVFALLLLIRWAFSTGERTEHLSKIRDKLEKNSAKDKI